MSGWNSSGEVDIKTPDNDVRHELGQVVSGSLLEGLTMKLHPQESVEDIRAGKFVVVEGEKNKFFSMITDVTLSSSSKGLLEDPPGAGEDLMREALRGAIAYGAVSLKPMLMLPIDSEESEVCIYSGFQINSRSFQFCFQRI